ncbi:MAG: RNA methyltransferase [Acidimicrobiia bacterium]|nr:RNA methyltransferase [Acidimicrobiia bacterium]
MPHVPIPTIDDPRLDLYRNVPDPELLATRGVFIAEGRLVVTRLLASRFAAESLLLSPAAAEALADTLATHPSLPVYIAPAAAISLVAGFNVHRGCLGVGRRRTPQRGTVLAQQARTLLVLERIGNADNVGGIFRNAAALGADGVLVGPGTVDPLYRKAIRTSMGATLEVPYASPDDWPGDLVRLREQGVAVVALTPSGDTSLDAAVPALRDRRVALLLGHEGDGLSGDALETADLRVRIPVAAGTDSINVASAVAVALHALGRACGPPPRVPRLGEGR